MKTATLLPVVAYLALSATAAPVQDHTVDKRWCLFGFIGDSCYTVVKVTTTSAAVVKSTSTAAPSSATSVKLAASSAISASSAVSSTATTWANCKDFDWSPWQSGWAWGGGFNVDYVKNWYLDQYGAQPPQGMNWKQVTSLVNKFGTKTVAAGPKATSAYKKGCSNPWTSVYNQPSSTASSSSVKVTASAAASSAAAASSSAAAAASSSSAAAAASSKSAAAAASNSAASASSSVAAASSSSAAAAASKSAAAAASNSAAAASSSSAAAAASKSAAAAGTAAASNSAAAAAASSSSAAAASASSAAAQASSSAAAAAAASNSAAAAQASSSAAAAASSSAAAAQASADAASAASSSAAAASSSAAAAQASADAAASSSSSAAAAAATPTTSTNSVVNGYTSQGCYQEISGRLLADVQTSSASQTLESCTALCSSYGFQVAGIEYGSECYCGSIEDLDGAAISGQCNMACPGDSSEICGGPNALTVFYNPSVAPATVVLPAGWSTYGVVAEGHGDRTLTTQLWSSPTNTIQSCAAGCAAAGFTVSGTEYSSECYCGNGFANGGGALLDSSAAFMKCSGDLAQACGGPSVLSVVTSLTGTIPSI